MLLNDVLEKCYDMSDLEFQEYILDVQLNIMDAIIVKKIDEGKCVFSEVENGLLN